MKKCKNCRKWYSLDNYVITDHTTLGRSKVCLTCNPTQADVPIPNRAVVYILGFYLEEFNQRYIKFGFTTDSAKTRLKSLLRSWSKCYDQVPYSKIIEEIEVPPLESYNIEQKILSDLRNIYASSALHDSLGIAGRKETFVVNSTAEAKLFVEYVRKLVDKYKEKVEQYE